MMDQELEPSVEQARAVFERSGGLLRMSEVVAAGIHRRTLRAMVEQGELARVSRGLYRLADAPHPAHPDLVTVAAKVPDGVICLVSALAFHELTTDVPHEVYLAIRRTARPPSIDYPPVRSFRFSDKAFSTGIETYEDGPVTLRVYAREKTLADCFKYRHKIGLDACLEALRTYHRLRGFDADALLRYAKVCRVANVMRPYIEAVL